MADYAVVAMVAAARQCGVAGADPLAMARRARSNAGQLALKRACLPPRCKSWCQPAGRGRIADFGAGRGRRAWAGTRWPQISLADIVEAVEGPIALTSCVEGIGHGLRAGAGLQCAPALAGGE
jgi:hypothetical protein